MTRARVFVSYSHHDERVLQSLVPYLRTLEHEELVSIWTDKSIRQGERWREKIDEALDAALVAILLVSQEFLASRFVRTEELPRILQRQQDNRLTVLPVFVSPSTVRSDSIDFDDAQGKRRRIVLSEFQGFGTPEATLSEMPVTERQRRFIELHERIRELSATNAVVTGAAEEETTADSLTARGERPRIKRIPLPRNRTFTGREKYLRRLHRELRSGNPTAVTQALAGLGGVGKTQLALEYSYRYGAEYDIVWWIRAEHQDTRVDDFVALGRALGIERDVEASRLVGDTLAWLERNGNWLLVFDNAEHPNDIRDLLPKSQRGGIIITSRYPAWRDRA